MLYMGVQCESCITGGGVAYSPAVCRPNADEIKLSVCFFSTSYAMMAETMAHEIGHNLFRLSFCETIITYFNSLIFSLMTETDHTVFLQ